MGTARRQNDAALITWYLLCKRSGDLHWSTITMRPKAVERLEDARPPDQAR